MILIGKLQLKEIAEKNLEKVQASTRFEPLPLDTNWAPQPPVLRNHMFRARPGAVVRGPRFKTNEADLESPTG